MKKTTLALLTITSLAPLAACQTGAGRDGGAATLSLGRVPAAVYCVRIVVQNEARVIDDRFDVLPGNGASMTLNALPLGIDTFVGQAYPVACANIDGSAPTWASSPVTALLDPGETASVSLELEPTGSANVCVGFDDGHDGGCTPAPGDGGFIPDGGNPTDGGKVDGGVDDGGYTDGGVADGGNSDGGSFDGGSDFAHSGSRPNALPRISH